MKFWKEFIAGAVGAALLAAAVYFAAAMLIPYRTDYGSAWEGYLREPENSIDVLVVGSSIVYCDIIPARIYQSSGITGWLTAGPELTMPLSYYYLRQACRSQTPKAAAVELSALFFEKYQNYTTVNIGYMPWGRERIAATFNAAEPQLRTKLLFPLASYHDRWYKVSGEELRSHLSPPEDRHAGYTLLTDSRPQSQVTFPDYTTESDNYACALEYLRRIADFCDRRDIALLLYIAPSMRRIPADTLTQVKKDLADIPHAAFTDFNEKIDELGLDYQTDWYDFLHFNIRGAEKFTSAFTDFLLDNGVEPSGRGSQEVWERRIERIDEAEKDLEM